MKIIPYGAAGGHVTGSAYLVQTSKANVLVDCGLFQGDKDADKLNRQAAVNRAAKLHAVVLTHGHLDHTGRLPLLTKAGFTGPIHATPATVELAALILRDSAHIQMQDAERHNRKRARAGEPPEPPLYTPEDVERTLQQFQEVDYHKPVEVAPGVTAEYVEAGHMLGSASIKLTADDSGKRKTLIFSGDLGPIGAPILKDYEVFRQADMVVMESTYGGRDHKPLKDTVDEFIRIVKAASESGGKILVPTFAVGRAQLLMQLLASCFRKRLFRPFPVFLDSPMAIEATKIYQRHMELFDDEALQFLRSGSLKKDLATLKMSVTAADSKKINDVTGPCLVLAGSGMCNAGRILHHLKQSLWKPETHVMIVGFQGDGTLGRRLVNGDKLVSIHGEKVAVKAQIHTLGGFSAHAGQTDLLRWISALAPCKPRLLLTHGEDDARKALAREIQRRHGLRSTLPDLEQVVEL